jgi:hypothetical protein
VWWKAKNPDIIGDKLIASDIPIAIFRRMFLRDKELQNKLKVKIALHTT